MKLSKAIELLQAELAKSGDLELATYNEFGQLVETHVVKPVEKNKAAYTAVRFAAK